MQKKKIEYKKERKKYFKRKPDESTISRFLQFKLPERKSLKCSVCKTEEKRTIAYPINQSRYKNIKMSACGDSHEWEEKRWDVEKIEYCKCQVMKSGTGHYIIWDSTKDHVEFWIIHPKLSYVSWRNKGEKYERNREKVYSFNDKCVYIYIGKDRITLIKGDEKIEIDGEMKMEVHGNICVKSHKSINVEAADSITLKAPEIKLDGETTITKNLHVEKNVYVKKDVYAEDCHCD